MQLVLIKKRKRRKKRRLSNTGEIREGIPESIIPKLSIEEHPGFIQVKGAYKGFLEKVNIQRQKARKFGHTGC